MRHFMILIKKIQTQNIRAMAPRKEVCQAFVEHADLFLKRTAWTSGCRSWFKQGKEDGPLSIWPGSRLLFFDALSKPRYEDYDISYEGDNPFGFFGNGFTVREYDGSDLSYYLGTEENLGALLPASTCLSNGTNSLGGASTGIHKHGSLHSILPNSYGLESNGFDGHRTWHSDTYLTVQSA